MRIGARADTLSDVVQTEMPLSGSTRAARHRRRRSDLTAPRRTLLLVVLGSGAALAVIWSDAAPTGATWLDSVYRAGLVALCGLAASRARRWSLVVASGLVVVGSDGLNLAPSALALALALTLAWQDRRNRVLGCIAGVLVGWSGLRLSWPASPSGATAVLAAVAILPLWVSGYRMSTTATRRRLRVCAIAGACTVAVGLAAAAVFAITQQDRVRTSADRTEAAARAVADGRTGITVDVFAAAAADFDAVTTASRSWWVSPARLVPVLAQNVVAVGSVAEAGRDLNTAAATLAEEVDFDALQLEGGGIDLELLDSFTDPVTAVAVAVRNGDDTLTNLRSPWLLGPLVSQLDDFRGRSAEAVSAATLAEAAVREVPALLGAEGPRRYLLLLGNPAEARDLGGHLGTWAELTAVDGDIDVVEVGDAYDLYTPDAADRPTLSPDLDLPASLRDMSPTRFPQNWGATADLASAATLAADLYPQVRDGAPLDGVLYADPIAFAALLGLIGPVEADGIRLDGGAAVEFLTKEQFTDGERSISGIVRTALDRFTRETLPTPRELSEAFAPAVRGGHLQFLSLGATGDLLRQSGLEQPIGVEEGRDALLVLNSNANPSKIDPYLRRTIDYWVDWWAETGELSARVLVSLANDPPDQDLHPVVLGGRAPGTSPGTNRTQISVLSPHALRSVTVDGEEVPWSTRTDVGGLVRYSVQVDVPPGAQVNTVFDLAGEVEPGDVYRLDWFGQPLLNPDDARLVLNLGDRRLAGGATEGVVRVPPRRHSPIDVRAEGSSP